MGVQVSEILPGKGEWDKHGGAILHQLPTRHDRCRWRLRCSCCPLRNRNRDRDGTRGDAIGAHATAAAVHTRRGTHARLAASVYFTHRICITTWLSAVRGSGCGRHQQMLPSPSPALGRDVETFGDTVGMYRQCQVALVPTRPHEVWRHVGMDAAYWPPACSLPLL